MIIGRSFYLLAPIDTFAYRINTDITKNIAELKPIREDLQMSKKLHAEVREYQQLLKQGEALNDNIDYYKADLRVVWAEVSS